MKYMVMECHRGYSVLMGEDAAFVKAANMHYEVGQTVEDPVILENTDIRRSVTVSHSLRKRIMTAAACLLIFAGFGAYIYSSNFSAYSSIIISADAQVRIEVNSKGKVISVVPLNEQGEKVLEGYDLEKGLSESDVAETLVKRYVKLGFLNSGDTVEFLIDAPDSDIYDDYSSDLKAVADKQESVSIKTSIRKYDNKDDTSVSDKKTDAHAVNTVPRVTAAKKQTETVTNVSPLPKNEPPAAAPPHLNGPAAPHINEAPPKAPHPEPQVPRPDEKALPDAPKKLGPEQKENENNKNNERNDPAANNKVEPPDNKKPVPEGPVEEIPKPDKDNERTEGIAPIPDPNGEPLQDNRLNIENTPEELQKPLPHEQTDEPIKKAPLPEQGVLPHQQNDNKIEVPVEHSEDTNN